MKKLLLPASLVLALLALAGCGRITVTVEAAPLTAELFTRSAEASPAPSYDVYEAFGLSYDREADALYFDGQRVRYFFDGVDTGSGSRISRVEHIDRLGTLDVHTLREAVDNGDGSVNPFGPLTGLEADGQAAFDARDIDALLRLDPEAVADGSAAVPGKPFSEIFAAYRDFGVVFVESPEGSGTGNVYYRGEPVSGFADLSQEGTFVFHSRDGGTCNVRTVYDGEGNLAGVERFTGEAELG